MPEMTLKALMLFILTRKEREVEHAISSQPYANTDTQRRLLAQRLAYIREAKTAIVAAYPAGDQV